MSYFRFPYPISLALATPLTDPRSSHLVLYKFQLVLHVLADQIQDLLIPSRRLF